MSVEITFNEENVSENSDFDLNKNQYQRLVPPTFSLPLISNYLE